MNALRFDPRDISDELFPYDGSKTSQLRFLLQYAILAPSHYNAQPWKFQLGSDSLDVYLDTNRVSRISDPDARESIISCGAATGVLEIAARYFGLRSEVIIDAAENQCRLVKFKLTGKHDPSSTDITLFHAIRRRQTNRNWFDDAELPDSLIANSLSVAKHLGLELAINREATIINKFASVVQKAVQRQFSNPWYRLEFASWIRAVISFKFDGVTGFGFYRPRIPSLLARPILRWFGLSSSTGRYNQRKLITGSPTLAIIATKDDSKASWINTGRMLSHFLLSLTSKGLSASFMNQGIQEADLRRQIQQLFKVNNNPHLVLRIGHGTSVKWTPRRPVEDTLINPM